MPLTAPASPVIYFTRKTHNLTFTVHIFDLLNSVGGMISALRHVSPPEQTDQIAVKDAEVQDKSPIIVF